MIFAALFLMTVTGSDRSSPKTSEESQFAYSDCLKVNFAQLRDYSPKPQRAEAISRALVRCGPVRSSAKYSILEDMMAKTMSSDANLVAEKCESILLGIERVFKDDNAPNQ